MIIITSFVIDEHDQRLLAQPAPAHVLKAFKDQEEHQLNVHSKVSLQQQDSFMMQHDSFMTQT